MVLRKFESFNKAVLRGHLSSSRCVLKKIARFEDFKHESLHLALNHLPGKGLVHFVFNKYLFIYKKRRKKISCTWTKTRNYFHAEPGKGDGNRRTWEMAGKSWSRGQFCQLRLLSFQSLWQYHVSREFKPTGTRIIVKLRELKDVKVTEDDDNRMQDHRDTRATATLLRPGVINKYLEAGEIN